jgi:hypothetical protein
MIKRLYDYTETRIFKPELLTDGLRNNGQTSKHDNALLAGEVSDQS